MSSLFKSTFNSRFLNGDNIPYHRYIRSDVPNNISKDEIDWLYKNNFTTIIDLRSDWEHEHESVPLEIDNRFIYLHKPVTIDGLVDIDNINGIVPKTVADVSKSYILMADKNMKNIINTILNAKTNVLYFCSAGKDRTGVVSAILMLIYKESRNSIIDDYMKSLDNIKIIFEKYSKEFPDINTDIIYPKREFIESFLDNVNLNNII